MSRRVLAGRHRVGLPLHRALRRALRSGDAPRGTGEAVARAPRELAQPPNLIASLRRTRVMTDLIYIVVTIVFFLLAVAYTYACEKL
jgi:hypothetical protein